MELFQCDDRNTESGDGCSSNCKIEKDYKCKGGNHTNPDNCQETIPPHIISFRQDNGHKELIVTFSELVKVNGSASNNSC